MSNNDYTPTNVTSGFEMEVAINANFAAIKAALDAMVSRNNNNDNALSQDLDTGGNNILNLPAPTVPTHPVRLTDLNTLAIVDVVQTVSYAATVEIDTTEATFVRIDLLGNIQIDFTGTPDDARPIIFAIKQDGTGSRVITWDTSRARFSTDIPDSSSTAGEALDYFTFRYNAAVDKFDLVALTKGF